MHVRELRLHSVALGAFALLVLLPGTMFAQGSGDRDAKAVAAYRLTDSGLAKFEKATHNLASLPPGTIKRCDDDEGVDSLDALVARLDANPAVHNAIQSTGMTTRDYALFTFATFQAGMAAWAMGQPGGKAPAGVSVDNVNFYRAHEADLKKLEAEGKSLECKNESGDE